MDSGETRQLTRGAPIHPYSAALHPDGATLVVTRGGELWAIDRATLAERRIFALPGAQLGECSISADGAWLTAAFAGQACGAPKRGLIVSRFDGTASNIIPFPRTVIHPQFHPLEPEWIEFSGDPAPRMHRVRRDGTGLECLYQHGNDEFIVHETFLGSTGDLVFTVWPHALRVMDWTTRAIRTIVDYNAWHIAPDRAGRRILCDTNHPDEGLQIIDAATGARRQVCLTRVEQSGLAVAQIQLRPGRGFRPGPQHPQLDGKCRRYGLRPAAHPSRIPVGAATNRKWPSPATAPASPRSTLPTFRLTSPEAAA